MANSDHFQLPGHGTCTVLTSLTREHLPDDLSFARRRRYRRGSELWIPTDLADRIYFLTNGQIVLMTDTTGRETIQQVVEAGQPFGELVLLPNDEAGEYPALADDKRRPRDYVRMFLSISNSITGADGACLHVLPPADRSIPRRI